MDPALGDEKAAEEISRAKSAIEAAKGEIVGIQKWGKRKLAYEIKKRREGIYAVIKFKGNGTVVSELERGFRLSEPVIRFLTVVDISPPVEGGEGIEEAAGEQAATATVPQEETADSALSAGEGPVADPAETAEAAAGGVEPEEKTTVDAPPEPETFPAGESPEPKDEGPAPAGQ